MGVILAPANKRGSGTRLVQAGASELYFGFSDQAWLARFGHKNGLNRMSGFGSEANPLTFDDLLAEAADVAQQATPEGGPPRLFCVFNSASYDTDQLQFIAQTYLEPLARAGFYGIIVSSPHLAQAANQAGLACVASTMCAVYNADIAAEYARAGIERVILPRDITLDEAADIVQADPALHYEVFLMRNGCVFSDSHCLGLHQAGQPSLCRTLRTAPAYQQWASGFNVFAVDAEELAYSDHLYRTCFHESTCGLCALWRFEHMGIDAYKVVGRGDAVDDLCADISLSLHNLRIARQCATEFEYLKAMLIPEGIAPLCRNQGLSCYYNEPVFYQTPRTPSTPF